MKACRKAIHTSGHDKNIVKKVGNKYISFYGPSPQMYYAVEVIYGNGLRTTNEGAICHSILNLIAVTLTLPAVRFLGQKIESNNKHLIPVLCVFIVTVTYKIQNTKNYLSNKVIKYDKVTIELLIHRFVLIMT